MTRKDDIGILDAARYIQGGWKDPDLRGQGPQIAPESQERASQMPPLRSHAVSQTVKDITERMLRLEIHRAIQDLGPQKTAQIVAQTFRLKGLPKELRRHL